MKTSIFIKFIAVLGLVLLSHFATAQNEENVNRTVNPGEDPNLVVSSQGAGVAEVGCEALGPNNQSMVCKARTANVRRRGDNTTFNPTGARTVPDLIEGTNKGGTR